MWLHARHASISFACPGGAPPQLEPGGEQLVLSSSGDRSACMWDLRKIGRGVKALASAQQNNTILSAYWAPDGASP